jgi:nicotinamidase-related amidase
MISEIDKNTALILIDLQNSIVSLQLAHPIKTTLENVNLFIDTFREKDLPVVVVNVNPVGAVWTKSRKEVKQVPLPGGDEWYKITDQINVKESDIKITKHTWNAFFETKLDAALKNKSITGIVLAGISTSIGVEGTARAASEFGYNITFATDAMTDMKEEAHQRSIQFIFPRMGETGTTREIIEMMKKPRIT